MLRSIRHLSEKKHAQIMNISDLEIYNTRIEQVFASCPSTSTIADFRLPKTLDGPYATYLPPANRECFVNKKKIFSLNL